MSGQLIILSGVTSGAVSGVERITMSAADEAALRVNGLAHVVSARSLTAVTGGGVTGRCRKTGKVLTPVGATPTALEVKTVGGFKGLGLSTLAAAALNLPAGSATESYCTVTAVNISTADAAGSGTMNFLYTTTSADAPVAAVLRYKGVGGSYSDKFASGGSEETVSISSISRPAGNWAILCVDFDNATKKLSMSVNGGAFTEVTKAVAHAPGVGGKFQIGYSLSSTLGFSTSTVGDLYVFNKSLRTTSYDQTQLATVIEAMKTDYSIA